MARVSFGSRAGSASDYLVGNGEHQYRQSTLNGVYNSLVELTDALRTETETCAASDVPELTTCELSIRETAMLPLLRPAIGPYSNNGEHDLPEIFKTVWMDGTEGYPGLDETLPKSQVTAILNAGEGQPRQIVQRAASRAIVQAIESTDGFKYSFNNAWAAKDDGGLRFSYICQDSMQNKDRHANGFTKTQKHLKGEGERGPRKPTYDCKGSISVKFSAVRKSVDIYYRHYAIHASVAERKPPPRAPPRAKKEKTSTGVGGSKKAQRQQDGDAGGLLGTLQAEKSAYSEDGATKLGDERPRKRKRDSGMGPPPPRADPNKPLSLMELLKQSEHARSPPPEPVITKTAPVSFAPPPVEYALPSWQAPPPPPPPPPVPVVTQPTTQPPVYQPTWAGTGYAPPYQPQQYQPPPPAPAYPSPYAQTPPVAIPRTPSQTSAATQQAYNGLPGRHPKAQGLFSTLKPVRKEEHTSYEPHFIMYQSARAKSSCQPCRLSKKKCDEGRPMCGACAKTGKLDCVYEVLPAQPTTVSQNPSIAATAPHSAVPGATQASSKHQVTPQYTAATTAPKPLAQYPTHPTATPYGSQPMATQYGTQPSPTQYTGQNPAQYSAQPTAAQYSAHQTSAQYGMQQMPSLFGTQQSMGFAAPQTFRPVPPAQPQSQSFSRQGSQSTRGGSPDPWFPRRQ